MNNTVTRIRIPDPKPAEYPEYIYQLIDDVVMKRPKIYTNHAKRLSLNYTYYTREQINTFRTLSSAIRKEKDKSLYAYMLSNAIVKASAAKI